jgi:hypothetical protein
MRETAWRYKEANAELGHGGVALQAWHRNYGSANPLWQSIHGAITKGE